MIRFSWIALLLATRTLIGSAQEAKLTPAQIPEAVSSAATQRFPDAKLSHWSKETDDGKTTFEVSVADGKGKRDAVFSPDGVLVSVETSIEVNSIPASVKSTIQEKYPSARIKKAEKITLASNEIQYEVDLLKAAKKEVLLSAEGKILKEE